MITPNRLFPALALVTLLGGCAFLPGPKPQSEFVSKDSRDTAVLSEKTVALNASTPSLDVEHAVLITDNDDAFEHKVRLVRSARETLDLAYFIFADDYSSSALTFELIEAAKRGVRVRLLVDYHSNYKRLDWFSMMEARGSAGAGRLEVRFFNRPSKNIVKDAVFLTVGCSDVERDPGERCSQAKFDEIEERFARERIGGEAVGERNISNLNIGGSGLFLSGLYAKNPQLMALAISQGQDIDPASLQGGAPTDSGDLEKLKKLGRVYFESRYGSGLERAIARAKLSAISLLYEEEVDPVYDAFTGFIPVERDPAEARRDWRYLTEYLHHKLLLADQTALLLGGRNVEDSYHMRANPLTSKYVFRDTDMLIRLPATTPALPASFDRLWQFDLMVATLSDVRTHAPNDYLVALRAANDACSASESDKRAKADCRDRELGKTQQRTLSQRVAEQRRKMLANHRVFKERYSPMPRAERSPSFLVESAAVIHYIENLPLHRARQASERTRGYGADNGLEGDSGKHIHAIWLHALRDVCTRATAQRPQRVIVHNAYFFPSSNLWQRMARMVDGREDCGDVTITVLTNSVETTDLNVVNIAARHSLKAFAEYAAQQRHPERGATFEYHEYRPPDAGGGGSQISLHSKVLVIGPHLFVGSANADVRSYMMDTNNGLLIRDAPALVRTYSRWVQSLLDDPTLTREVTDEFRDTPRAQMLEQDRQTLRAIFEKYRAERWIKEPIQQQALEETMVRILDEIYRLTKGSLGDGAGSDKAAAQFNDRFKTI